MTQQTKVTTTPAQLVLRVVGVAFATVVLFVLLAVLGNGGGTAEAADRPAGLGTQSVVTVRAAPRQVEPSPMP